MGEELPLVSVAGSRLSALTRLRDRLSMEIDTTHDQRSLVLLATRLQSVLAEIDEIGPAEGVCPADEIAERRRRERLARAR